jgi:hypothetical protein
MAARWNWFKKLPVLAIALVVLGSWSQVGNAGFICGTPLKPTDAYDVFDRKDIATSNWNEDDWLQLSTKSQFKGLGYDVINDYYLYKSDADSDPSDGYEEEGYGADWYDTEYGTDSSDPNFATISHLTGQPYQAGSYAFVKAADIFYVFDISGWDGLCDIQFEGWKTGDYAGISHVTLYAAQGSSPVPEPLTLGLMASGMACAGFVIRKRRKA